MKTKWVGYYTGIDILDLQHWKVIHPYFQRDRKTKKLQFARIGYDVPWSRYWRNIGIFIGRQNYSRSYVKNGFQLFTNRFHFGIGRHVTAWERKPFRVDYSGSALDPYCHVSYIFFGLITFGFDTPKWFREWKCNREMNKWVDAYADWVDDDDDREQNY